MTERLAFPIQVSGEATLPEIHAEPLPIVVADAAAVFDCGRSLRANLPDWSGSVRDGRAGGRRPGKNLMLAEKNFSFPAWKTALDRVWPGPILRPATTNDTWEASRGKSSWT